jgi:hypothetical protein
MDRTKSFIPLQSSPFADDYDVYVDYGKGQPVKMNNNESTFIDVEKFLIGQNDQSNIIMNKKSINKNTYKHDRSINSEQL